MADSPRIAALLKQLEAAPLPTIDLSLDRVREFMDALGNPERNLPPVIHVAGTNGKGSTIAYLRAIYEAYGLKVHVYTSPHLVKFNERIVLAGEQVDDDALGNALERVLELSKSIPVTAFESTTAAAFLLMAECPADLAIIEVGMGGRLDATNIVESPAATVITSISMDHCEFLGDTIDKIATEKAGIIKPYIPCILSKQLDEAAMQTVADVAHHNHALLPRFGKEYTATKTAQGFHWQMDAIKIGNLQPSLAGEHQYENAATAITTVHTLQHLFGWQPEKIRQGIDSATWPARLQRLRQGALYDLVGNKAELWIDGGHNPAAGEIIASWLAGKKGCDITLIVGMVKGKDIQGFLQPIAPLTKQLFSVLIPDATRSYEAEEIAHIASQLNIPNQAHATIESALLAATQSATESSRLVLICGSLALMGKVLEKNS